MNVVIAGTDEVLQLLTSSSYNEALDASGIVVESKRYVICCFESRGRKHAKVIVMVLLLV